MTAVRLAAASNRSDAIGAGHSVARNFRALAEAVRVTQAEPEPLLLRRVAVVLQEALAVDIIRIAEWESKREQLRVVAFHSNRIPSDDGDQVGTSLSGGRFRGLHDGMQPMTSRSCSLGAADAVTPQAQTSISPSQRCDISVPIPLDDGVWGELYLARAGDHLCFGDNDVTVAMMAAIQVGSALAMADQLDEVHRLLHVDSLTGLANRRAVDEMLHASFGLRLDERRPVGLIICDMNGLKHINDGQGHDAGDRALAQFAELLRRVATRLPDALPARLGGDEFCIVARGATAAEVVEVAAELCRLALHSTLNGVSCGVACTNDELGPIETPGRLLRLADAAQYRAKRSRSDSPVVAGRDLPPDVAEQLALRATNHTDRRGLRVHDSRDSWRLIGEGLDLLDENRNQSCAVRLASVADIVAAQVEAMGWWLYDVGAGEPTWTERASGVVRHGSLGVPGLALPSNYSLTAFPETAALMDGGARAFHIADPDAASKTVAVMEAMGALSGLEGGCRDSHGNGWLVEFYGDGLSRPFHDFVRALRVLMAVAVHEAPGEQRLGTHVNWVGDH